MTNPIPSEPFGSYRTPKASPETELALVGGLFRVLSVFRWVTLGYASLGVALSGEDLIRPAVAWALLVLMAVTTLFLTSWPSTLKPFDRASLGAVIFELSVGVIVLLGDSFVYSADRAQSLPWSWPAAGIMAAGILFGARAGFVSSLFIGAAGFYSETIVLERSDSALAAVSKLGLWVMTGTLAGYVVTRLRRAEAEISVARAREEVVRELHDGVLQTLAVIQRRSDDAELAALARDQEHDLRGFLAGSRGDQEAFEPAMRRLAAKHEKLHPPCKVSVVVAQDLPALSNPQLSALTGAVGEALTNAGKHGHAKKVTIYAEPAEDSFIAKPAEAAAAIVFVSIKDDGLGFDMASMTESIGISSSIRGRIEEVGGTADIESTTGRGTEVQLWV